MKKNIHIQLGGYGFLIDEEAYSILQTYLNSIRNHLDSDPAKEEILKDIEMRLAELWFEKHKSQNPINTDDVQNAVSTLGDPETIGNALNHESSKSDIGKIKKRLYRNPDDVVIGGVCSGISAYLGVDPVFVRLSAVALLFLAGTSFWIYLLLWVIVPAAESPSEKLAMHGENWTWDNVRKILQPKNQDVQKGFFSRIQSKSRNNHIAYRLIRLLAVFTGIISLIVGAAFLFGLISFLFALGLIREPYGSIMTSFFENIGTWLWIKILISTLLGVLFFIFSYFAARLLFRIRGNRWVIFSAFILFILCLAGLLSKITRIGSKLKEYTTLEKKIPLHSIKDSVFIHVKDSAGIENSLHRFQINIPGIHFQSMDFIKISDSEKYIYRLPFSVVRTHDTIPYLTYSIKSKKNLSELSSQEFFSLSPPHNIFIKTFGVTSHSDELLERKEIKLHLPYGIRWLNTDSAKFLSKQKNLNTLLKNKSYTLLIKNGEVHLKDNESDIFSDNIQIQSDDKNLHIRISDNENENLQINIENEEIRKNSEEK